MKSVLITAFCPYEEWTANASQLCLEALAPPYPENLAVTRRLYPVSFTRVRELLEADLQQGIDVALHLGQAPGRTQIELESFAINAGGPSGTWDMDLEPLAPDGPAAFRSSLPLGSWARRLRQNGIPARVSFHAGTFLCNATLYWTHYLAQERGWPTRAAFVHLPLETAQVIDEPKVQPFLTAQQTSQAVKLILEELAALEQIA